MANLHILTRDGLEFRVVAHVAVAAGSNSAGVPWRTAILLSKLSTGLSVLPDGDGSAGTIDATEKANLASGALIEVQTSIKPSTESENNDAYLQAQFLLIQAAAQARFTAALKWFGKVGG